MFVADFFAGAGSPPLAAQVAPRATVHMRVAIDLHYEVGASGADFVFNLQCARTPRQMIVWEQLDISQSVTVSTFVDPISQARELRLAARPGQLHLGYRATLDLDHFVGVPLDIAEVPVAELPHDVMTYIYPSRYCQSDRLATIATEVFGHLPHGYGRILAIQSWVRQQVKFAPNTSNSMTSALDTLTDRVGVCRDFAHLMIALCRALNIPARFTTGIDYGADPILGPTDFHAYVEVYLGHRWFIFDPSGTAMPMGFVRIGTGRDAADVSFATIFGNVTTQAPTIEIVALTAPEADWILPYRRSDALSTDTAASLH